MFQCYNMTCYKNVSCKHELGTMSWERLISTTVSVECYATIANVSILNYKTLGNGTSFIKCKIKITWHLSFRNSEGPML